MASTTIDSLVVTLGLNAKGFAEGIKGSTEQLAGFAKRLTGVFFAVRGVEDVIGYFKDLHTQLADIGFQAKNLGVMGTEISRLGEVSKLFGGQIEDAADSVQGLQAAVFNLKFRGQMSDSLMMLQRFGIAYMTASGHARDIVDIARDAARVIDAQEKAGVIRGGGERYQMALSFGLTGGLASAAAQGAKGFDAALKKANQDQKAITERTIRGQVELDRALTRNSAQLGAASSVMLSQLTPAIIQLSKDVTRLAIDAEQKIEPLLKGFVNFFEKPPLGLGKLEKTLGFGGSLFAGLGALSLLRSGAGALLRGMAGRGLLSVGAEGLIGAAGGASLIGGTAAGYTLDKLFPKNWLAQFGGWLGSETYDLTHREGGGGPTPLSERSGKIVRIPSTPTIPPTPNAQRPASAAQASGGSPLALVGAGGTNVEIGSITINTKATDANGIAADLSGAIKRKLIVSSADAGQG